MENKLLWSKLVSYSSQPKIPELKQFQLLIKKYLLKKNQMIRNADLLNTTPKCMYD